MSLEFIEYMNDMDLNSSISKEKIVNVEDKLRIIFPDEYRCFMEMYNGAEGAIGKNNYLVIWSLEEIVELNEAYGVVEFTPSLVYFGSDGGGMAYAFDKRTIPIKIVKFPFDSIHIEDAKCIADSFSDFIQTIYSE